MVHKKTRLECSTFKQVVVLQVKEQVAGVLALRPHVVQVDHVHVHVVVEVPLTGLAHVTDVMSALARFSC